MDAAHNGRPLLRWTSLLSVLVSSAVAVLLGGLPTICATASPAPRPTPPRASTAASSAVADHAPWTAAHPKPSTAARPASGARPHPQNPLPGRHRRSALSLRRAGVPGFALSVDPPLAITTSPSTAAGGTGAVRDRVRSIGSPRVSSVTVAGLPVGARATFAADRAIDLHRRDGAAGSRRTSPSGCDAGQRCGWLTVRVGSGTSLGDYPLTVLARTDERNPAGRRATVVLRVGPMPGTTFTISGDLAGALAPGVTLPLDLTFSNPNPAAIRIDQVTVAIDRLDPDHVAGCPVADNYLVTQFSGSPGALVVPAGGSASFSSLALASTLWPQVSMLATDVDQSGCLGAVLTLAYSGTATPL